MRKALPWLLILALVAGAAALLYLGWMQQRTPPPSLAEPVERDPEPAAPRIRYPIPPPSQAEAPPPLPALDASDATMLALIARLFGEPAVALFHPDNIVRRAAVSVDNLPREQVPPKYRLLRPVAGEFRARAAEEGKLYLSDDNYPRYTPYVTLLETVEPAAAVEAYIHFYPLFQKAFAELGYPDGYFNDRLVAVIDDLLATPVPRGPIELVRPSVAYKYADPRLEKLSAGQKTLLRMGPENAERVRAKLQEFRALLMARVGSPKTQ